MKLPINACVEIVYAKPKVPCSEEEITQVLHDLSIAVENQDYIPQVPTNENPALSDDYIFDTNDQNLVLKDLTNECFAGKIIDLGKGAIKRKEKGYPQEYLYVFKYSCKLLRRDAQESGILFEEIVIYIKINNRKIPYEKVFIVSFHKNKLKN